MGNHTEYLPVSDRHAGWIVGAFILINALIVAAVGLGAMWLAGAVG